MLMASVTMMHEQMHQRAKHKWQNEYYASQVLAMRDPKIDAANCQYGTNSPH